MERIRKTMTDIGTTARQAALMGEEELAEESRQKVVDAVVRFSQAFQTACYEQTFDPRIAIALERHSGFSTLASASAWRRSLCGRGGKTKRSRDSRRCCAPSTWYRPRGWRSIRRGRRFAGIRVLIASRHGTEGVRRRARYPG